MKTQKTVDFLPTFHGYNKDSVCFKTGSPKQNGLYDGFFGFEDVTMFGPSALSLLFERMLLGDLFPFSFYLNRVDSLDRALAVTLFQYPELVTYPATASYVMWVDLYERLGVAAEPQMPENVLFFLKRLSLRLFSDSTLPTLLEVSEEFKRVIASQPPTLKTSDDFEILEALDQPYIYYSGPEPEWEVLYSMGYLGGVWESPRGPIAFKKSVLVKQVDLQLLTKVSIPGLPGSKSLLNRWRLEEDCCVLAALKPTPKLGLKMWTKYKSMVT